MGVRITGVWKFGRVLESQRSAEVLGSQRCESVREKRITELWK